MKYKVIRDSKYDFLGQSYGENCYPNIHKYPATMIPQIGVEVLKEFDISSGALLDPYCGSGSSFASGLACGLQDFTGFDLNPLAVVISKTRFSKIDLDTLRSNVVKLRVKTYNQLGTGTENIKVDKFNNFDYWFSEKVASKLQLIKNNIYEIVEKESNIKEFMLLALSSTIRDCSYVRNNEFKLYRMKEDRVLAFNPDVVGIFFNTLDIMFDIYTKHYYDKLTDIKLSVSNSIFKSSDKLYDVVLTSPPYGDSKTTVAYGQFSMFANSWALNVEGARSLDKLMMGGKITKQLEVNSLIDEQINEIRKQDEKRAFEVVSFYKDLGDSIKNISESIAINGFAIYVVGNRTVKGVNLRTDQFIAEQFEFFGLKHLVTYERVISNKRMPKLNSPSNQIGHKVSTINNEFIVVCKK